MTRRSRLGFSGRRSSWSGAPLLRTWPPFPFAAAPQARLAEEELRVREDRMDAELDCGRAAAAVPELRALVESHPLRERPHAQLMLALYRDGRQADALSVYGQLRERLVDELGVEPGTRLQSLHVAILRHDPSLMTVAGVQEPAVQPVRPRPGTAGGQTVATSAGVGPPPERVSAHAADGPGALPRTTPTTPHSGPPTGRSLRPTRRVGTSRPTLIVIVLAIALAAGAAYVGLGDTQEPSAASTSPRPALGASSLGILDPVTGTVVATIPTIGDPGLLAAGDGALWVADPSANTLTRIDLSSRTPTDTVPLPGQPAGAVVAGQDIWVADRSQGEVLRVSTQTDAIVQRVHVGGSPSDIAAAGGRVWVSLKGARTLVALDAETGQVLHRTVLDTEPTELAVGRGAAWVTSDSAASLYRVDTSGKNVVRIAVGQGPGPVTLDGGEVWVANTLDGTVSRVNAHRGVVTATVSTGPDAVALTTTPGMVWVANSSAQTLIGVDSHRAEVARTVHLVVPPTDIARTGDQIWLATGASTTAHRGGTLRVVAAIPRFDSIDPGLAFTLFPPQLLGLTNDGLVTLNHVGGSRGTELVPDLASTVPTPTGGGRTYRFALRRGIRYSDGHAVRPADFRRAIERDYAIGSPGAGFYSAIRGARGCSRAPSACDLSQGITVDGAHNAVTFHLTRPDPDFLHKLTLTFAYAIPAGTPTRDIGSHPIPSTGPYQVSRYRPGKVLVLTRNPVFRQWAAAAQPDGNPDRILWRFGLGPNQAVDAVVAGNADWGLYPFPFAPPGRRLHELRTRYPAQLHTNPLSQTEYFSLNTRVAPFNDVRVRRALNDAINRNTLVRLYGGRNLATATCQVLPPGIPGYARYCPYSSGPASAAYRGPRLAAARHLVQLSGTHGMAVDVLTGPHFPPARYVAHVLRTLGYRARVRVLPEKQQEVQQNNSRYRTQISGGGWAADYPSAAEFLDHFLSCHAFQARSDDNVNISEFCDSQTDRHMATAEALQLVDPTRAERAWQQADRRVTRLAPWLPTVNLRSVDFLSQRVGGYAYNPQWGVLLDQLWVQ